MQKHEAFERLLLVRKLVKAKLYDDLEETVEDMVWELASNDWKAKEKERLEKKAQPNSV